MSVKTKEYDSLPSQSGEWGGLLWCRKNWEGIWRGNWACYTEVFLFPYPAVTRNHCRGGFCWTVRCSGEAIAVWDARGGCLVCTMGPVSGCVHAQLQTCSQQRLHHGLLSQALQPRKKSRVKEFFSVLLSPRCFSPSVSRAAAGCWLLLLILRLSCFLRETE